MTTEQVPGNELTVIAGSMSVTGYPSPAGTVISAVNGHKVPVPVVATGTLAVSLATNGHAVKVDEKLRVSTALFSLGLR